MKLGMDVLESVNNTSLQCWKPLSPKAHSKFCTHKSTLLVYGDKLGAEQRGWKGKLLYTRVIGATLVLPWGSAVELILMWSAQRDSLSQAAGVHEERPGASISICFLSSLDWPLLTKGAGQSVRGAGVCQWWPGPKESCATMPSIPCLPFHFRGHFSSVLLAWETMHNGRGAFYVRLWWIIN